MSDKLLNFEEAYKALEEVAEKLSYNDITLDEAISLYEKGIKLSEQCATALKNAQQKIETLKNYGN